MSSFNLRLSPACFLLLLFILGMGCNVPDNKLKNPPPTAAVSRVLSKLDSIKALPPGLAQSQGLQRLFNTASPEIRNAACFPLLKVASKLLFYHTAADTTILSFFQNLSSDKSLSPINRAKASQNIAAFYAHFAGEPDSARFYLSRATENPAALDDTLRNFIIGTQAQIYQIEGNLPAAAKSLYEAIKGAEKIKDSSLAAKMHGNLANVYRSMEDFPKSIAHSQKAVDYFRLKADSMSQLVALGGIAADYVSLKQADSARSFIQQSLLLIQKGVVHPLAEYYLYITTAGLYINLKDYDSAILWFDKAKAVLPLLQNPIESDYFVLASARAYAFRKDVTPEAKLIKEYIPQFLEDSNLVGARDAFYSLYMIALRQPATGNPLNFYQLYDSVRTVISDKANRTYLAEMEAKYGAEKQLLTIQLQQRKLEQRGTLIAMLGFGGLSLVLAVIVFYIRFRLNRSRRKAKMQQRFTAEMLKNTEAERGRIAMDLHDGIGHELLTLKHNLHQQMADNEGKIDVILNNLRMLSRNLHPVMLDKIGLEHSVYALCEQITAGGQLFVSAEIAYEKDLKPDCELQLYRIIQESLSNAVKYAEAYAAKVTILRNSQSLLVTVMDNGKGFDVSESLSSNTSFGLHSILERSKVLGGKALFTSGKQGTTLTIEIPLA